MRKVENAIQIFCPLRKKWLVNTPEEWVRQHTIQWLHLSLQYPYSVMVPEFPVQVNGLQQRVDILVFEAHRPFILAECKKPAVPITQKTLNQSLRYAQILKADYVLLTNGLQHIHAKLNIETETVDFIDSIPFRSENISKR